MDRKVFGRSDRFCVRESEEEPNRKAYLLLDASDSMTYRSGELSKLEYGSVVAASLAQLMLQQRDAVGLALFNDRVPRYLPPRGLASPLTQILAEPEAPSPPPTTRRGRTF